MRLRPYKNGTDFDTIQKWITDERSHALWCAGRFAYPLQPDNFNEELEKLAEKSGEVPLTAESEDGKILGFFCYSPSAGMNEGFLKFVIVAPDERGTGTAGEMLRLALKYAFETRKAEVVRLSVFTENPRAKRCYEKAGFREVSTEMDAFLYKDEQWGRCKMEIVRDTGDKPGIFEIKQ